MDRFVSEPVDRELTEAENATNKETQKHIDNVQGLLVVLIEDLKRRLEQHDASKLVLPEVGVFAKYTPLLAGTTYGSDEYERCLKEMKEGALDHHYANNRHHPEHFEDGVSGMNLVDLVEMLCDWKAATLRHNDGDISKSIEFNKDRFGISDQLVKILRNSVKDFGWE